MVNLHLGQVPFVVVYRNCALQKGAEMAGICEARTRSRHTTLVITQKLHQLDSMNCVLVAMCARWNSTLDKVQA